MKHLVVSSENDTDKDYFKECGKSFVYVITTDPGMSLGVPRK